MSEYTRNRMVDLWRLPSEKIVVIAEGVNVIFRPIAFTKDLRQRLNLLSGPYLLALGSLEPRKNLNRLLRAWEITQSQLPENLWLVLAGAKGTIFREAGLSSLPPRTHLTGYVPESALSALYSGALAFLYQSVLYEGFGMPPLEAMAYGTPVLPQIPLPFRKWSATLGSSSTKLTWMPSAREFNRS